jgi:hypothetical protein
MIQQAWGVIPQAWAMTQLSWAMTQERWGTRQGRTGTGHVERRMAQPGAGMTQEGSFVLLDAAVVRYSGNGRAQVAWGTAQGGGGVR